MRISYKVGLVNLTDKCLMQFSLVYTRSMYIIVYIYIILRCVHYDAYAIPNYCTAKILQGRRHGGRGIQTPPIDVVYCGKYRYLLKVSDYFIMF